MGLPLTYHWRNLFVRRSTTLLTVLVVAAVTAVLAWLLSFAAALRTSLAVASDARKIIVLKRGATAESNSAIRAEDMNLLTQVEGLETDPQTGRALISPEMIVQVQLPRLADGGRTAANVAVRGVTEIAFAVHRNVRLEGRCFAPGGREVIVGRTAARQFAGLQVGDTVNLGFGQDRGYVVVGTFSADGGPMESEIWGYLPSLMNAYNRTLYSSASLRVAPGADPRSVIARIEGPAVQLNASTEADYWREQAMLIRVYLAVAGVLVGLMAVAAVLSIANTMYASVAGRTREIAMLRTIGFGPGRILAGFVLEAAMLALTGGLLGCAACAAWLELAGNTKDMFGATTFTSMAFEIVLNPRTAAEALACVVLVGAAGALLPARRAARLPAIAGLREA